jgi:hypothetical protein
MLNDDFTAIEVRQPDGVGERTIRVVGEICWKENLFESYHGVPSSNTSFAGLASLNARVAPFA